LEFFRFFSGERETPRGKPAGSYWNSSAFFSRERETPRGKPVASPDVALSYKWPIDETLPCTTWLRLL